MPLTLISSPSVAARLIAAMTRCAAAGGVGAAPVGHGLGRVRAGVHAVRSGRMSRQGLADAGHAEHGDAVAADDGDGLVDLVAFGGGELAEAGVDPGDEPPDPGDLLLRGQGLGVRPVVQVGGGEQAFPVAQQVIEVGLQVGQVGHVGAEVVAAGAAEPVRAGLPAGLDVGRLGADPERDGDLADGAADVLGVQQRLRLAPDAVAVPVELHRRDPVDGLAAACLADPVVLPGGVEQAVVHQLAQHVDRDAGVGVPLGVGVPVGIREILALSYSVPSLAQQRRQPGDPGPVPLAKLSP